MGYYMNQQAAKFGIKKENFAAALAAIKALANRPDQMGGGSTTGERWYSWVTTKNFVEATTLADALGAWRWNCLISDKTGDLVDICFEGEKLGDDFILLEAIAPFVEPGSFIQMEGEDSSLWRWLFDGKSIREVNARITWPE